MRIAHFGPFAPHQCGMYESVREMILAERMAGIEADLVDTGNESAVGKAGQVDERDNGVIRSIGLGDAAKGNYDLFVISGGVPDSFISETKQPLISILHGRPESAFRLSQKDPVRKPVYRIHASAVGNSRYKRFVTLWPEHLPYWKVIIPSSRLTAIENPPCDLGYFKPDGPVHKLESPGKVNVLVCDVWRDDVDPFHVVHGIGMAAEKIPGLKLHIYGANCKLGVWGYIVNSLKARGVLGELYGMMFNLDQVMRACDFCVTPHFIATRIIRESLACGLPVLASYPCRYTPHMTLMSDATSISYAVVDMVGKLSAEGGREQLRREARESAKVFGLDIFGREILRVYESALRG